MSSTDFSENALVEQPAIELLRQLGWPGEKGYAEKVGTDAATLGRQTTADVILWPRLRAALRRLNPSLPEAALQQAVDLLAKDRSALGLAQANREVYHLLKDGVRVSYTDDAGDEADEVVRVIDWTNTHQNDFLIVSQFWVSGPIYKRRADLVGFVNGLPLLFIELKKAHGRLEHAYSSNLRDYKQSIPQLFWYNALIILSNGDESKVGSITSGWEHFSEWKRITSEGETGVISLETVLRGTCEPTRFLDLVENFTLFDESKGGLVKVTAKNHQFLGVNNAVAALWEIRQNQGRLGVFWHTQGSGKSFSMVFFAQKVLRKVPGNWTFVVVTDRDDLDTQIYRNFRNCGAATEDCQAESGEHLQRLLREDHRFVFTLIQKFGTKEGRKYPQLSDRRDIILMTDEAHRSQYDTLALNMRNALPNAAFIGFTGTPLMAGEEHTRRVFGDYVSIYNFRQSLADRATVPLFYENRVPELQLSNDALKEDLEELIDQAELNEDQQKKLERVFAREYHLITRDDRLEKVAEDLVAHFLGRGQEGKGMVICIDKLTAVRMYDKVRRHWQAHLADLQAELPLADSTRRPELEARIRALETTDMAVVISSQQNEVAEFEKRGLDIRPHRERMVREHLETKFKDPDDPFRLVFVCAMWLTGFDAPCVSTIYLDKPMKNHTLMQTIARANRVFRDKVNGLIVDYVGVFRDLQRALSIYGAPQAGDGQAVDSPIEAKDQLVAALQQALAEALAFCDERGVVLNAIVESTGFQRIAHLSDAANRLVDRQVSDALDDSVEKILVNDELKKKFLGLVDEVVRFYKAILPDPQASEFTPLKTCLAVLAEKIRAFGPEVSIDEVMEQVEGLLDQSIATVGYVIHATETTQPIDLGEIDFEALQAHFEKSRQRTEAEKLKGAIQRKLADLVRKNKTRVELGEKLKKLIDEYNQGLNVEVFFANLLNFARELTAEERRGVAEQLSEEELAVFDLLTRPAPDLSAAERKQVKEVSRKLLQTLKQAKLVLDWRQRLRTRADVLATVKTVLDDLPRVYSKELYEEKCETVWQHVYDSYFGEGESVYGRV